MSGSGGWFLKLYFLCFFLIFSFFFLLLIAKPSAKERVTPPTLRCWKPEIVLLSRELLPFLHLFLYVHLFLTKENWIPLLHFSPFLPSSCLAVLSGFSLVLGENCILRGGGWASSRYRVVSHTYTPYPLAPLSMRILVHHCPGVRNGARRLSGLIPAWRMPFLRRHTGLVPNFASSHLPGVPKEQGQKCSS